MKKVTFFIIMIVSTLLCSCGTTANYASADSWEDGIYYRKSQERTQEIFTDNKEIEDLVHKTKEEARRYTETIIISDAVSEQDSTLNRQYEINLNFYEDPWQDSYYSYNSWMYWGPSWSLYWDPFWYPSYWGPSWGWGFHYGYYGWYDPWYSPWYDPWYYYPVYPVYPFYPQYAVNDGPVVYGKRESGRSSSLSSSVQRGNLLTSNKELGEQQNPRVHHSAVDRTISSRNIRTKDMNVKAEEITNRKMDDKFLSSKDRVGLQKEQHRRESRESTQIKGNFRRSESARSVDNETFRGNVSRDFRTNSNRDYRNNSLREGNSRNSNTSTRSEQRSSSYSGSYNRSGSFGTSGGSGSVRNSGGTSGGGGRARR